MKAIVLQKSSHSQFYGSQLAIQKIFLEFQDYCRSNDIGEETIENLRCHGILIAQDLEKTYTFDKRIHVATFNKFMKDNSELVFLNVDKSIDIAILTKQDYHKKLSLLFDENDNFEKIPNYNMKLDLESFSKMLTDNLGNNLNSKTKTWLEPESTTSLAYGLIKLHKVEKGL